MSTADTIVLVTMRHGFVPRDEATRWVLASPPHVGPPGFKGLVDIPGTLGVALTVGDHDFRLRRVDMTARLEDTVVVVSAPGGIGEETLLALRRLCGPGTTLVVSSARPSTEVFEAILRLPIRGLGSLVDTRSKAVI